MGLTAVDFCGKAVRGTWFHAPHRGEIEVLEDAIIVVDEDGVIDAVLPRGSPGFRRARRNCVDLTGHYLLPGLVDLHVHAPQYPQLGQALDEPLEIWLGKYTFSLEARYADLDFARPRYAALIDDLLANGTTTALYFATVHLDATKLLADLAIARGQRALVGKVAMDDPESCPPEYRDSSAEAAIADTRGLIDYLRAHPDNREGRVLPVVTPRFTPSCTDAALAGLGHLAQECACHIQTHCSESDWAHAYSLGRFGETDTTALDRFGLLGRRTVLAHSNFLTDSDMETIRSRGSAVAHCPVSNAYFANSVFPLRRALDKGVHVGLGTDISGGPISSIFDAARATVQVSRMLETGVDATKPQAERGVPGSAVTIKTAFYLATAGGGEALDLPIGRFEPGCRFDAMAIDPSAPLGSVRLFGETEAEAILEKLLYTATRPNIAAVWVDGRVVGQER
jgi:guanine deaminase